MDIAQPKVDKATPNGIMNVKGPKICSPNFTATAGAEIISLGVKTVM